MDECLRRDDMLAACLRIVCLASATPPLPAEGGWLGMGGSLTSRPRAPWRAMCLVCADEVEDLRRKACAIAILEEYLRAECTGEEGQAVPEEQLLLFAG